MLVYYIAHLINITKSLGFVCNMCASDTASWFGIDLASLDALCPLDYVRIFW